MKRASLTGICGKAGETGRKGESGLAFPGHARSPGARPGKGAVAHLWGEAAETLGRAEGGGGWGRDGRFTRPVVGATPDMTPL